MLLVFVCNPVRIVQNSLNEVPAQGAQNHNSPTGIQIIRVCIEIYRKIDETVKLYINSY